MPNIKLLDNDVVIVSAARTPIGGFQGVFSSLSATELGAAAIKAALDRSKVELPQVEEVVMGNVLCAGVGQAPARQAALGAGVLESTACTTVSKVCGSGMKAVMMAHDQLKAGSSNVLIAGGMESMTNAPYFLSRARKGMRLGHGEIIDHMFYDGLEDAYTGKAMGAYAQDVADARSISREAMDGYALRSLQRAQGAIDSGHFADEVIAVTVKSRASDIVVKDDEQPANAKPEKIPNLKPAFSNNGTITAANSSSISDGAAAMLITTALHARQLGLEPMAKLVGHATHAQAPSEFCLAPIGSINTLLRKISWTSDEVDLFEINEAFAMVSMLAMQDIGLDHAKVNISGGACALGHPIGASGARIIVSLLHALKRLGKVKGVASLCIGGGEATSIAVEML